MVQQQSLVCCTWLAARMGSLVQRMLVTKARSWHQVVLVQLVNGSSGLARVFNSSTIVSSARFQFLHNCGLCSPFSDCARHSPLIAGNPSTSGGEIETADCEIWSAAALRLLYSQCTIVHIVVWFYSQSIYCCPIPNYIANIATYVFLFDSKHLSSRPWCQMIYLSLSIGTWHQGNGKP